MNSIERCFHDLERIAPAMEALQMKDDAKVFFDLLSGALIWSDEYPRVSDVSVECLRYIVRYRTGLIVGVPQKSFEQFWQEALRRFPKWIGFSAERTSPNELLARYYHEQKRIAGKEA